LIPPLFMRYSISLVVPENEVLDVKTGHEKTLIERQIEATDRQIDALVYELYGLTEEEIGIVGGW